MLDGATIARTKRVNGESLEWCDVYDRQHVRWSRQRLTGAQREEVARLQDAQRELRAVLTQILELADELGRRTIEGSSPRATLSSGLEYVLGSRRRRLTTRGVCGDGVDRADGVPALWTVGERARARGSDSDGDDVVWATERSR